MAGDYAKWLVSTRLAGRTPLRTYAGGISADDWLPFTQHWTWRSGIDAADHAVVRACRSQCSPDEVALDVGANIGVFSLLLAQAGFPRVIAFEPVGFNVQRLKANLQRNASLEGRIEVVGEAVGEQAG